MNVVLSEDAAKQFNKLPKSEQAKVKKKLHSLEIDPLVGKKLTGELEYARSLRAWPYRIIYEINDKEKRVEILRISHRQGAYK